MDLKFPNILLLLWYSQICFALANAMLNAPDILKLIPLVNLLNTPSHVLLTDNYFSFFFYFAHIKIKQQIVVSM